MPTFNNGETGLSVRNKLNKAINLTDRVMIVDDVTQLANLVYDLNSQWGVAAGMQVMTAKEGFLYDVLASGASVFDIQPGAVKLDALPGEDGSFNFRSMLPAANGTTDDYPLLARLLAKPNVGVLSIYFPNGNYFMGSTIELKRIVRLWGDSGYSTESAPRLTFPANTWGIVVNRGNTLNGGTETVPTGGADGSEINGLYLISNRGSDRTKHGIWLRARAVVMNTFVRNFPGNGIAVIANCGAGGSTEGNANSFFIANCICTWNSNHGFYADGDCANAGTIINLDCSDNGRCGIYDSSFLGNTYIGCHTASNGFGSIGGNPIGSGAMVSFGGNAYVAHWNATEAQLVATEPGTNPNVWIFDRPGGPFTTLIPLWVPSQPVGTYFVAFGYIADSPSASNVFLGCYSEGGPPGNVFLGAHMVIGGSMSISYTGNRLGAGTNGVLASSSMLFGGTNITTQVSDGANFLTMSGINPLVEVWRFKRMPNANLRFDNGDLGSRVVYEITGPDATVPFKFSVGDFLLAGRLHGGATSAPANGTGSPGDVRWNTSGTRGQPWAWMRTNDGTWQPLGLIP
jgi:hypothetical protein